jgi:xanthine dehydrogenase accessory factor
MTSLYREVAELLEKGERGVLCSIVDSHGSAPRKTGSKLLLKTDGTFIGTVGGGGIEHRVLEKAREAIVDGKPRFEHYELVDAEKGDPGICGGAITVYVEPVLPPPRMVIVGGGHVGKSLAHLAKWAGFQVVVSDDREEFCTPEAHPDADQFHNGPVSTLSESIGITADTFIVFTTRGNEVDIEGLPPLFDSPAAFIGVIGAKRRWMITRKALLEAKVSEEKLNRVHSPVGLELNAETPEEIAISIMAEIIMVRGGGSGKRMKI